MAEKTFISPEDAIKCLEIRKRSKKGIPSTRDESKFCETMFRRFPDWYRKTEARVFNETVPFGSDAHMNEGDTVQ